MARRFQTSKVVIGAREITTTPPAAVSSGAATDPPYDGTPFCLFAAPYAGVLSNLYILTTEDDAFSWTPGLQVNTGVVDLSITLPTMNNSSPAVSVPNTYTMSQGDQIWMTYTGSALPTGAICTMSFNFTRTA